MSSREQAENCHALEQQIDRLKSAGVEYVFVDVESGANPERLNYNKLIQLVEKGAIKMVIATRWDRLTRNELVYLQLKNLFQYSAVKLKLLDQGDVDLNSAFGELSADMQALFAVHERRMLKERVSRGFEYKRKKKSAWGRQPWGYKSENEKYVIDRSRIICLLSQRPYNYQELSDLPDNSSLLVQGLSKGEIAKEAIEYFLKVRKARDVLRYLYEKYGVSSKANNNNLLLTSQLLFWRSGQSFCEWIKNPVLRGHTAYNKYEPRNAQKRGNQKPPEEWEIHENTHPDERMLSDEEYCEVVTIIEQNSRTMGTMKTRSQLTGLIICGECGSKCINKNNQIYRYYGCRNSGIGCSNKKQIRVDLLEAKLFDFIIEKAHQFNGVDSVSQVIENPEDSSVVIKLKEQKQSLEKMLQDHYNLTIKKAINDLDLQIKKEISHSEIDDFSLATAAEVLVYPYITHLGFWYCLNTQERELIYHKLIKKIVVLDSQVTTIELKVSG
ncbi:site-specific recombinases (plasmid) [Geminocystis sp. NIES-3708]|nr:site-specific recombinases [Geminocystis sp. NIES-3708]